MRLETRFGTSGLAVTAAAAAEPRRADASGSMRHDGMRACKERGRGVLSMLSDPVSAKR